MPMSLPSPLRAATAPRADAAPAGWLRPADGRQARAVLQALLAERRHVALSCPDTATLEHYARLLVRDLRRAQARILDYAPTSTDALLQRFNGLLADLPLHRVVDRQAEPAHAVRVFVVHDTPALSPEEFALLVRLVGDLPGANLRIVLVQDRDLGATGSLLALGPQVLHWAIEPPPGFRAEPPRREPVLAALPRDAEPEPPPARPRAAPAAAPAPAAPPAAPRRLRTTAWLAAGLLASAALAATLGWWLHTHAPAAAAAASAPAGRPR